MSDCVYCGATADTVDHVIPVAFLTTIVGKKGRNRNTGENNMVDACRECNCIASDKVFDSIESKREYIQGRLEQRYRKIIDSPDWTEEELEDISIAFADSIREKMLVKRWVINRIAYPCTVYTEYIYDDDIGIVLK